MSDFIIRECTREDMGLVLSFIRELAVYEKMIDEVVVTEDLLYDQLLVKKLSACVLAFEDNVPVGFALYFFNFSTFLGKNGLYLEDLFVRPAFRGKGYGKKTSFSFSGYCQTAQLRQDGMVSAQLEHTGNRFL